MAPRKLSLHSIGTWLFCFGCFGLFSTLPAQTILLEIEAPWRSEDGHLAVTCNGLLCEQTQDGQFRPTTATPAKDDRSAQARLIQLARRNRKGPAMGMRHVDPKTCQEALRLGLLVPQEVWLAQQAASTAEAEKPLQATEDMKSAFRSLDALKKITVERILPPVDALHQQDHTSGV
ncbi:MAG: hypothetical protein ACOYKZ_04190 [Chlamydiia bacterium]